MKAALYDGEVTRGQVPEILGLGDTAGREIIRLYMSENLLDSASTVLRLVFSAATLNIISRAYQ